MDDEPSVRPLSELKPKSSEPASVTILMQWIRHAEKQAHAPKGQHRMEWLIASTVVIAALQRAVDVGGTPAFLLKGGTLLQHRLGLAGRATKDVDGLVRGDIEEFLEDLDDVLAQPWGPFTLSRSEVETIATPTRVIAPRRLNIVVSMRGRTWRKIQIELASDEGDAGQTPESVIAPDLAGVGLSGPDRLVTLAMRYQIAQKIHACSDPHNPPDSMNDRPRDVVDLILLRELVAAEGSPTIDEIAEATRDIFRARAADAVALGVEPRTWPTTVVAHPHWPGDYAKAAADADVALTLDEAVAEVNAWLGQIASA